MTLLTLLKASKLKDLKRVLKSEKDWVYFKVDVFNAGMRVTILCTNTYKRINYGNWNGYDSIHENDELLKEFIKGVISDKGKEEKLKTIKS